MNSGLQQIWQSINTYFGGAFHKMFGEANSLLEMFVQNFVTSLAKDALSSIGGPIGSILSGILGFQSGGWISEQVTAQCKKTKWCLARSRN